MSTGGLPGVEDVDERKESCWQAGAGSFLLLYIIGAAETEPLSIIPPERNAGWFPRHTPLSLFYINVNSLPW